jgi:predicted hydrocarbon binding protein
MDYAIDDENGVIKDTITGERCIIITKSRLEQILARLTEIFQSGAAVIIAEAMKAAGERYAAEVPEKTKTDYALFLKTAVQRFTEAGLGKVELVEFDPERLELKFRIRNNLFAEMHSQESTFCNCVGSFVSGVYQQVTHEVPRIKETKCIGKGDPYCEWHVSRQKK